jgi:hypothetical protein
LNDIGDKISRVLSARPKVVFTLLLLTVLCAGSLLANSSPPMVGAAYALPMPPPSGTVGLTSVGSTNYPTGTPSGLFFGTPSDHNIGGGLAAEHDYFVLEKYTLSVPATVQSIEVFPTTSGNVKVSIYTDNGGEPDSILFTEVASAVTGGIWDTITVPSTFLAPGDYWLAFNSDTTGINSITDTGGTRRYHDWTYATPFPNPLADGYTSDTYIDSIFANYVQIDGYVKGYAFSYTDITGGAVASFYFYAHDAGNFRLALYTDDNGNPSQPKDLLWSCDSTAASAPGWNTVNRFQGTASNGWDGTLTHGTWYWLLWQWDRYVPTSGPSYTPGTTNYGVYLAQDIGNYMGDFPSSWAGAGTNSAEEWSEYLTYVTPRYLTVTTPDGGVGSNPTPVSGWFGYGTEITASVNAIVPGSPGYRYVCTGWTGTGDVPASGPAPGQPAYTVTFTITQTSSIDWHYKGQVLLTVKTNGLPSSYDTLIYVGETSTIDDYGVWKINDASSDGWRKWFDASTGTIGVDSPVAGATGTRYLFKDWSDASTVNPHASLALTGPLTLTVNYRTQYHLKMSTNLGSVSPVSGWRNAGSTPTITATPPTAGANERYVFNGWTGSGTGSYSGPDISTSVTMNGPISETASWTHQFYLTVNTPDGGVGSNPNPVSGWFDSDTQITASVTSPVPGSPGYQYPCTGWTGSGSVPASGTTSSTTFIITQGSSITWNYKTQYLLTVATSGLSSSSYPTHVLLDGSSVGTAYDGLSYTQWFDANSQTGKIGVDSPVAGATGTRYLFKDWSDASTVNPHASLALTGPLTLTGNYQTQYLVHYVATGCSGLTVTPPADEWVNSGAAGSSLTDGFTAQVTDTGTRTRCNFVSDDRPSSITGPSTVIGTYQTQYKHIITSSPVTGLAFVNVGGVARTAPYTTPWWDSGSSHTIEALSPLNPGGGISYVFVSWSDGGAQSHSVSPTSPTTFTATYQTQYRVNAKTNHGVALNVNVVVDGNYASPMGTPFFISSGTHKFAAPSTILVSGLRYNFLGWRDPTGAVLSKSVTFTYNLQSVLTAVYGLPTYTLTVLVYDSTTRAPLMSANVRLDTVLVGSTDSLGRLVISVEAGSHNLKIAKPTAYSAYTTTVNINSNIVLRVFLNRV